MILRLMIHRLAWTEINVVQLERWMKLTGKQATLESTGQTFDQVKAERTKK